MFFKVGRGQWSAGQGVQRRRGETNDTGNIPEHGETGDRALKDQVIIRLECHCRRLITCPSTTFSIFLVIILLEI